MTKFKTIYRLEYDFTDLERLERCITMLRGLGLHWYKIYKIEKDG